MATAPRERGRNSRKRGYHHGDLRAQLVQEACAQIEKSFHFTIRDLARSLGVTHAAAYRHFRSKRDLLAAVATEGFRGLEGVLTSAAQPPAGSDPRVALKQQGVAYVKFAVTRPGLFRAMFHPDLADKSDYPELESLAVATFRRLVQTIESGQRDGSFRSGAVDVFSTAAWALVHGLACLLLDRQLAGPAGSKAREAEAQRLSGDAADVLAGGLLAGVRPG